MSGCWGAFERASWPVIGRMEAPGYGGICALGASTAAGIVWHVSCAAQTSLLGPSVVDILRIQVSGLLRGKLEVTTRIRDAGKVRGLLSDWYKARAKETFARRLDAVLEQALWVETKPPLRTLTMQTQWGSCSPNGRITLNPHLVKAPRECIDYVILHELCHMAEHNHSERFYRLMGQVMPDWEKTKERLDGMASVILSG